MQCASVAVIVVALVASCGPGVATPTSSPPQPALTSPAPTARTSDPPLVTARPGACARPGATPEMLLETLFALSTSADAASVLDCYARRMREEAGFPDFARRWSTSGPASVVSVRQVDRVKGCDRFAVDAELAHGEAVAHFGKHTTFFSVGLEGAVLRIHDAGSGLAASEFTSVTCG